MHSKFAVQRVKDLPRDIRGELKRSAKRERFEPIQWLIEEWDNGSNRFSLPGEALYAARVGQRLVGICGLNRDPYTRDAMLGRLRRLYVLSEYRRQGIGRLLVQKAVEDAAGVFKALRLRTMNPDSAKFFEALGFRRVKEEGVVSHALVLES